MPIETHDQLLEAAEVFVSDEGAFKGLNRAIGNLENVFYDNAQEYSEEVRDRLVGNQGLKEWGNGLGHLVACHLGPHFSGNHAKMKKGTVESVLENILNSQREKSHFSKQTGHAESQRDAPERCSRQLRDWFNKAGLPNDIRLEAQLALNDYETQWGRVKKFLDDVEAYFKRQPA